MGKYGRAAIRARELLLRGMANSPQEAWEKATDEVFATPSSREKNCPRGAFLGLCQTGLVKGIHPGDYTRSEDNKTYALQAVALIKKKPALAEDLGLLWSMVGKGKKHNSQMDVVVALWEKGFIN